MPCGGGKEARPFAVTGPGVPEKTDRVRWGMQAKIVLLYSLLIFFALQLSGVYLVKSLEGYYLRNYANNQLAQGELLGSFIRRYLLEDEQQGELISSLVAEFGGGIPGTETITMVLDRHGRLLGGPEQKSLFFLKERVPIQRVRLRSTQDPVARCVISLLGGFSRKNSLTVTAFRYGSAASS